MTYDFTRFENAKYFLCRYNDIAYIYIYIQLRLLKPNLLLLKQTNES